MQLYKDYTSTGKDEMSRLITTALSSDAWKHWKHFQKKQKSGKLLKSRLPEHLITAEDGT